MLSERLPRLVPHCASLLAKARIGESLNPSASGERLVQARAGGQQLCCSEESLGTPLKASEHTQTFPVSL